MNNEQNTAYDAPLLVVGVGASAGGLQAFKELMAVLPADSGMAFVLIQHLDPKHESLLSELLAPRTSMPVRDAEHNDVLCANVVYVIKPGCALAVRERKIVLSEPTLHRGVRLPVDHLFRSLAKEYGARAVGIVLSGAGSDGSSGLRDIKTSGGMTIAQDLESSGQTGMPQSAIDSGYVDLILSIDSIPRALTRFSTLPESARVDPTTDAIDLARFADDSAEGTDDTVAEATDSSPGIRVPVGPRKTMNSQDLNRLNVLVAAQVDFDLSIYKPRTVQRRVMRRMLLAGFDDVPAYFDYLRSHPAEQQAMVRDLLISVTSFFRDPAAYTALRENVIEPTLSAMNSGDKMRVWIAGCATGEEAYSIAMLILDAAAERKKSVELQMFATDIDQVGLTVAREGVYSPSAVEAISARRLDRYFELLEGRGYRVRSRLRDVVSFALHDLTKDPPFSRMNLVSCRNVMIYLTPTAQQHVLGSLHFALLSDGCLFLSTSEAPGARPELFAPVSKAAHIYRKTGKSRPVVASRSASYQEGKNKGRTVRGKREDRNAQEGSKKIQSDPARQAVLQAWVPPTIIVNETGHAVFLHGELSPYLQFPQGDNPRLDLNAMLRGDLATRTLGALYRCRRDDASVVVMARSESDAQVRIRVTAKPALMLGPGCVMLTFEQVREDAESTEVAASGLLSLADADVNDAVVRRLDEELKATREDLRNTVEELESTNEELRSSNEESMSMNEELQSSNEELEATTEELRSLNEELSTVNAQLRDKIEQLETSSNDLSNFFASARVPIVFLDENLRIKRFTPAAAKLLLIDQGDVGRFTGDIARELLHRDLEQEARNVLSSLDASACEMWTREGRWFSRRVLPYLTDNRRVEGVVVTLTDITDLKVATEMLAVRENQQRVIARLGLAALGESDLLEFMNNTVREVRDTLRLDYCKILELQPGGERLLLRAGVGWRDGLVGKDWVDANQNSQAGYTLSVSEPVIVEDLAKETRFSGPALLTDHNVTSGISCAIQYGEQTYGILGAHTVERRNFSMEDANFLQAVANIIGTIINNHEDRWRRILENLVQKTLTDSDGVDDMLGAVQVALTEELDCEASELWWADEDGQFTCLRLHTMPQVSRRDVEAALADRDQSNSTEILNRVSLGGNAVWTSDISEPGMFNSAPGLQVLGFTSAFGFPISEGEHLKGIITLYSRRRMFANELFLRTLEIVGASIGIALDHLRHEEHEERLAAITASSHDAIFSHDLQGQVTEWLPGAEWLYGYTVQEMIGQSIERLIPPEHRRTARDMSDRVLSGEVVEPVETLRLTRDDRLLEVSVVSSTIRSNNGEITGFTSTERDITRLKDTERRLLNADQQKNEFLAMLGHELRNPLSSMRTAAELLRQCASDDPEVQYTQEVFERQTAHMAKLLDGLLDVSRIVHGKISLDKSKVDFAKVCREVLADSARRALDSGRLLQSDIPDRPLVVDADRVRLVQIVDNLVSNALRHTQQGGTVKLSLSEQGDKVVLIVSDDGVGIEPDMLPRIFDVFWQSKQNLDRAQGGLGIGLSLVRTLSDLHGGELEARSEGVDQGAEFVFRLPVSNALELPLSDRKIHSSPLLDILIIEDNRDSADMISRVLKRYGHQVRTTYDGESGIECARQQSPDVVLCDLGLPDGITGYDVARKLSQNADTSSIRLIALSGYGEPAVKDRCRSVGFHSHLTKPIGINELMDAVSDRLTSPV